MGDLSKMFSGLFRAGNGQDKDAVADLVAMDPKAYAQFEAAYKEMALDMGPQDDNFYSMNSRDMAEVAHSQDVKESFDPDAVKGLIDRAVAELLSATRGIKCLGGEVVEVKALPMPDGAKMLTNEDLAAVPASVRPQCTGSLMVADFGGNVTGIILLSAYKRWKEETDPAKREKEYFRFRQGLDILDLDPLSYEMLSMNPNSMSHWLPAIARAAKKHGFFKIPETKIVKVPMPILQLSRMDYTSLNQATLRLVDEWAMKAFDLDVTKTYFVKTGTYSSKYDFRNCRVTGKKEVRELGEYLVFISNQASFMAGPLNKPHSLIGVSTTNEWVVREFVEDVENNPCIYMGLSLHTEYRAFVDFDTGEVLAIHPYWDPDGMMEQFSRNADRSVHHRHDYVTFKNHIPTLMARYNANKDKVVEKLQELLPDTDLHGQWSVDIMQNGDDFWLIDMALAAQSTFCECIPAGKLRPVEENWLPPVDAVPGLKSLLSSEGNNGDAE